MDLRLLEDDLEVVSRLYAERFGIDRDDNWFLLKLHEEVGELTQAFLMRAGQARDKGFSPAELDRDFRAELSDVLARGWAQRSLLTRSSRLIRQRTSSSEQR